MHWPLIVFSFRAFPYANYATRSACVLALSVTLAYLSYQFVEQPFRRDLKLWTPRRLSLATGGSLAALYEWQRRYDDAEPLYRRTLAIWEKALGPDHPDVATAHYNLANVYHSEGRYAEAKPLHLHSLLIREKGGIADSW